MYTLVPIEIEPGTNGRGWMYSFPALKNGQNNCFVTNLLDLQAQIGCADLPSYGLKTDLGSLSWTQRSFRPHKNIQDSTPFGYDVHLNFYSRYLNTCHQWRIAGSWRPGAVSWIPHCLPWTFQEKKKKQRMNQGVNRFQRSAINLLHLFATGWNLLHMLLTGQIMR